MPFKKGAKPGPGRPEGSKNKNYLNLNIWFEMIHDNLLEMPVEQKLQYSFRAAELLLTKVQVLPGTPGDSKTNADQALAELKAAEEYGINRDAGSTGTQPGSNGVDVAGGSAEGEAST